MNNIWEFNVPRFYLDRFYRSREPRVKYYTYKVYSYISYSGIPDLLLRNFVSVFYFLLARILTTRIFEVFDLWILATSMERCTFANIDLLSISYQLPVKKSKNSALPFAYQAKTYLRSHDSLILDKQISDVCKQSHTLVKCTTRENASTVTRQISGKCSRIRTVVKQTGHGKSIKIHGTYFTMYNYWFICQIHQSSQRRCTEDI